MGTRKISWSPSTKLAAAFAAMEATVSGGTSPVRSGVIGAGAGSAAATWDSAGAGDDGEGSVGLGAGGGPQAEASNTARESERAARRIIGGTLAGTGRRRRHELAMTRERAWYRDRAMRQLPLVSGAALLAGALALGAGSARADIVPSGYKPVKLSIEVQAEVPEGHTLLLINTFKGATKLPPGKSVRVDWHPLHGKMQVVSATATQLAAIEKIAEDDRGDDRMPKMQAQSTPCADPFDGVRTVKDTERYDEIRWHYTVSVDGKGCKGALVRTSYRTDGEELKTDPPAKPSDGAPGTEQSASPKADAPTSDPPKNAPATPASTCAMMGPVDDSPAIPSTLALLAGLAMAARARRRR